VSTRETSTTFVYHIPLVPNQPICRSLLEISYRPNDLSVKALMEAELYRYVKNNNGGKYDGNGNVKLKKN